MEDMPTRLVAAIPPAPAPAPPPAPAPVQTSSGPLSRLLATLSFRDWVQLVMAAIIVIAALTGHVTLREAASLAGKPFGF